MRSRSLSISDCALCTRVLSLALAITCVALPAAAQSSSKPTSPPQEILNELVHPEAVQRSRVAGRELRDLKRALTKQSTFKLRLFEDTIVSVRGRPVDETLGAKVWSGSVQGAQASAATFLMRDDYVTGRIRFDERNFTIVGSLREEALIVELDVSRIDQFRTQASEKIHGWLDRDSRRPAVVLNDDARGPGGRGRRIDVLGVYTADLARVLEGWVDVPLEIALIVEDTETIMRNSGVKVNLHVVDTMEVEDPMTIDPEQILHEFAETNDGIMDAVHAQRDAVHADLVSLMVRGTQMPEACGLAYIGAPIDKANAAEGFSVVRWDCHAGYAGPHEIGHNLAGNHDGYVWPTSENYCNKGFVNLTATDASQRFVTLMAYTKECSDLGLQCYSYPVLSSPRIEVHGVTTGAACRDEPAMDNAIAIRKAIPVVADYR